LREALANGSHHCQIDAVSWQEEQRAEAACLPIAILVGLLSLSLIVTAKI